MQVSPNTGAPGQANLSVTLLGAQGLTHFAQGTTTASFGRGITVVALTVYSLTSATAVVDVGPAAVLGVRTVVLTTGSETARKVEGFMVARSFVRQSPPP